MTGTGVAADEDHDALEFDHKLQPLPELGKSINVYFNDGDTALIISDRTKSNPTRLGSRGPRMPLSVPGTVSIMDASKVVTGLIEHSYHVEDEHTVRDILATLEGKPQDQIGDGRFRRYMASQNRYVLTRNVH